MNKSTDSASIIKTRYMSQAVACETSIRLQSISLALQEVYGITGDVVSKGLNVKHTHMAADLKQISAALDRVAAWLVD